MPCRMTTATKIPIANAFPSQCNTRPTLTFNEISRKCKHDMKYQKVSSITLTKQICNTSAPGTVVMQRNDHLIFRWLERGKKQITGTFTIAMSGPFLLTQLIYKERSIAAFQKVSIFLLILMGHAQTINQAISPKEFSI